MNEGEMIVFSPEIYQILPNGITNLNSRELEGWLRPSDRFLCVLPKEQAKGWLLCRSINAPFGAVGRGH